MSPALADVIFTTVPYIKDMYTRTHTLTLTHSHSHQHMHTHTLAHTHTHTHTPTHTHTHKLYRELIQLNNNNNKKPDLKMSRGSEETFFQRDI